MSLLFQLTSAHLHPVYMEVVFQPHRRILVHVTLGGPVEFAMVRGNVNKNINMCT